jgi:hypothetical protein
MWGARALSAPSMVEYGRPAMSASAAAAFIPGTDMSWSREAEFGSSMAPSVAVLAAGVAAVSVAAIAVVSVSAASL